MAYSTKTLNSNWFEERAPPLKGVVADYGTRQYASTNSQLFQRPGRAAKQQADRSHTGASRAQRLQRQFAAYRGPVPLITERNLGELQTERPNGGRPDVGFGALLPAPTNDEERFLSTHAQEAFGVGKKKTRTEARRMRDSERMFGGPGGPRASQGAQSSGATGEVFKDSDDPQENSAVQRSWTYAPDPMIDLMRDGAPEARPAKGVSLQVGETEGVAAADRNSDFRRKVGITGAGVARDGVNVWQDC